MSDNYYSNKVLQYGEEAFLSKWGKFKEEENFAPPVDPKAVNQPTSQPTAGTEGLLDLESIQAQAEDKAALEAGMQILQTYKGESGENTDDAKKGIELLNKALQEKTKLKEDIMITQEIFGYIDELVSGGMHLNDIIPEIMDVFDLDRPKATKYYTDYISEVDGKDMDATSGQIEDEYFQLVDSGVDKLTAQQRLCKKHKLTMQELRGILS